MKCFPFAAFRPRSSRKYKSNIAVQESLIDLVLDEKVKCRDVFVGDKTTDKMSFDQIQLICFVSQKIA